MLVFILFFIFVFLVILLILSFCNKRKKQNRNTIINNQKVHFKFSILKNLYAEFDYEIYNNDNKNNNSNT